MSCGGSAGLGRGPGLPWGPGGRKAAVGNPCPAGGSGGGQLGGVWGLPHQPAGQPLWAAGWAGALALQEGLWRGLRLRQLTLLLLCWAGPSGWNALRPLVCLSNAHPRLSSPQRWPFCSAKVGGVGCARVRLAPPPAQIKAAAYGQQGLCLPREGWEAVEAPSQGLAWPSPVSRAAPAGQGQPPNRRP